MKCMFLIKISQYYNNFTPQEIKQKKETVFINFFCIHELVFLISEVEVVMPVFSRRMKICLQDEFSLHACNSPRSRLGNLPEAGCQPQNPGTPVQNIPAGWWSFRCKRRSQYSKTQSDYLHPSIGIRTGLFHDESLKIGS